MKTTFRALLAEGIFFSLLYLFSAPLLPDLFDIEEAETAKNAIMAIRIFSIALVALIIIRVTAILTSIQTGWGRLF